MARIPIDMLVAEVEKGLATDAQKRIRRAMENQAFYDYDAKQYMDNFSNEAETAYDYANRPYRECGLTHQVIDILTEHLYAPGPTRVWSDAAGDDFLQRVYTDNHIDAVWNRADQLSTLNDVAAIQVDVDEGIFEDKPVTFRVWGGEEFHVWSDPDNRTRPVAACTIDRYDESTRYRLWTDEQVLTFTTKKGGGTSGGRVATQVGAEPNTYGCLPFAFAHYEQPIRRFWEPGIGCFLAHAEARINDRLSRTDHAINKHLDPKGIAEGVPDGWNGLIQTGKFVKLPAKAGVMGKDGDYSPGPQPHVYYLQVNIDSEGAWLDLTNYLNQVLQAAHVPGSAVRMEQQGMASGIALMVEQAPILSRARRRRAPFAVYESDLARTALRCAGNHYARADLVNSARTGMLALGWPTPTVPVQTDDWLALQTTKVQIGLTSMVQVAMQEYGVSTREQAIAILKQVRKDQDALEGVLPELPPLGAPTQEVVTPGDTPIANA